jgi:hypothetical protein
MNVRQAFALGLGTLLLVPLVVAVAPIASAAECLSVSGGGLSYGSTYTLRVTNSCPQTDYARYLFNDGTFGFTAEHSGFVSVLSGFDSTITVNLSNVAAGTHLPSIKFFEQGPYYGSPRFSLPSYTIAGSSTSRPTRPQYAPVPVPVPAPVVPRFPACSSVQHPTPATGKQVSAEEAEYTWTAVPGISSYTVAEGQWDGKVWTESTWKSVGSATSHRITFAPGSSSVTIWVASECSGTFTVKGTQSVARGIGTLTMPNLESTHWFCVASDGATAKCTRVFAYSKKQSKNVKALVTQAVAGSGKEFARAGIQPAGGVAVETERTSRGVTVTLTATFAVAQTFP